MNHRRVAKKGVEIWGRDATLDWVVGEGLLGGVTSESLEWSKGTCSRVIQGK